MRVGIILFSRSGNTLAVATRLQQRLVQEGNVVGLERLELVTQSGKQGQAPKLVGLPDMQQYQAVILGSPVEGFAISPPMRSYLAQTEMPKGQLLALLLTQGAKFAWFGGNQALRQLRRLCEAKGGVVRGELLINWSSLQREQQIVAGIEQLSRVFR